MIFSDPMKVSCLSEWIYNDLCVPSVSHGVYWWHHNRGGWYQAVEAWGSPETSPRGHHSSVQEVTAPFSLFLCLKLRRKQCTILKVGFRKALLENNESLCINFNVNIQEMKLHKTDGK